MAIVRDPRLHREEEVAMISSTTLRSPRRLRRCSRAARPRASASASARAQRPRVRVRFLAVRTPHGVDRDFWIPRNSDGGEPGQPDEALSGLTFEYENSILNAMMPWRDQDHGPRRARHPVRQGRHARRPAHRYHGHNEQGTLLTGAQAPADREGNFDNHPSLDFYLHGLLGAPVLLTASVEGAGTWKCMSFDAAGIPRDAGNQPERAVPAGVPGRLRAARSGRPRGRLRRTAKTASSTHGQAQLAAARSAARRASRRTRSPPTARR